MSGVRLSSSSSDGVRVVVPSPALSFLFLDNANSLSDQEGFLLGEVVHHTTDAISDTHMSNQVTETLVNVYGSFPCDRPRQFYNNLGQVDELKLRSILNGKEKEVVGWYRFRREFVPTVSVREMRVHRDIHRILLSQSPPFCQHTAADSFLFCLLTTSIAPNSATHTSQFGFFRMDRFRRLQPVPLTIKNLGDTTQTQYKNTPSTLSPACGIVQQVLAQICQEAPERSSGALHATTMQATLQAQLHSLCDQWEMSEAQVEALENEVQQLRQKVKGATGVINNEVLLPMMLDPPENPVPPPDGGSRVVEKMHVEEMAVKREEDEKEEMEPCWMVVTKPSPAHEMEVVEVPRVGGMELRSRKKKEVVYDMDDDSGSGGEEKWCAPVVKGGGRDPFDFVDDEMKHMVKQGGDQEEEGGGGDGEWKTQKHKASKGRGEGRGRGRGGGGAGRGGPRGGGKGGRGGGKHAM